VEDVVVATAGCPLRALELNDSSTMIGRQMSADHLSDMVVDELYEMRRTAGNQPVVMSVVLHSFIARRPFRFGASGRLHHT
jgi:hypothetical protein